jgi:hypothetical protein
MGPQVGPPGATAECYLLKTISYEVNSVGTRPIHILKIRFLDQRVRRGVAK